MKKVLLIALAFISIQAIAQERRGQHRKGGGKERTQMMKDLTPEQAATLQTKKMTLRLDLTEGQQKEIYKINLANAKERKAKIEEIKKLRERNEKPSKESRYNMMNERLDKQIAMKKQMKSILSEEQYKRFERGVKQQKTRSRKAVKERSKKLRSGKS
jgi:hypothetical protein